MRWISGVIKILLTTIVLAVLLKLVFVYVPKFDPLALIQNQINWFSNSGKKENTKIDSENQEKNNKPDSNSEEGNKENTQDIKNSEFEYADMEAKEGASIQEKKKSNSMKKTGEYFLSYNEISSFENISISDKLSAISIISKVKKADIDKILPMIDGGITFNEMKEAEQLLEKNLNPKEVDILRGILTRNKALYAEGKLK